MLSRWDLFGVYLTRAPRKIVITIGFSSFLTRTLNTKLTLTKNFLLLDKNFIFLLISSWFSNSPTRSIVMWVLYCLKFLFLTRNFSVRMLVTVIKERKRTRLFKIRIKKKKFDEKNKSMCECVWVREWMIELLHKIM